MLPTKNPDRTQAIITWANLKRGPYSGNSKEAVMRAAYNSFVDCGGEIHTDMSGLLDFRVELGQGVVESDPQ